MATDFIDCTNSQLTEEQLFAALATKDAEGNWALRTMIVDACETDAIDCANSMMTTEQIKAKMIGINHCGKPALRLASPVASYANDAAAASGSVPVGGLYYKTGVGLHTRMS